MVCADALSVAAGKWKEEAFLDAFDSKPTVLRCFVHQCTNAVSKCCSSSDGSTKYVNLFLTSSAAQS